MEFLQERRLSMCQYKKICEHMTERVTTLSGTSIHGSRSFVDLNMYGSLWRDNCCPHMVTDVCNLVNNCNQFPHMGTKFKHRQQLELLPPADPLEFVAIDILGPLPRIKSENKLGVLLTDRYSKITRAIPKAKIISMLVARTFFLRIGDDTWNPRHHPAR